MIGLNHGLSGAAIAYALPLPFALPLALASHFILDMLPHYGLPHEQRDHSHFWRYFTSVDAVVTLGFAIYAISTRHYAMFLGGLFATMPDYIWVGRIIKNRSFDLRGHGNNRFTKWHADIQRFEHPWGILIEIPLLLILFYYVMVILW